MKYGNQIAIVDTRRAQDWGYVTGLHLLSIDYFTALRHGPGRFTWGLHRDLPNYLYWTLYD